MPDRPFPTVTCAGCMGDISVSDAYRDEQAENYFCDRVCFDEWAAGNIEQVAEHYWRLNIDY